MTLIVLFASIQLSTPVLRLGAHDTLPRFGWQMFSAGRPAPEFRVETPEGALEIDHTVYMANPRSDIDVYALMPRHLCEVVPEAIRVTWPQGGSLSC